MIEELFQYKRYGFHLTIFPNRIAVTDGTLLSLNKKEYIVPISQIASIKLKFGKMEIETTGGKRYKWILGNDGKKCKQIIDGLL